MRTFFDSQSRKNEFYWYENGGINLKQNLNFRPEKNWKIENTENFYESIPKTLNTEKISVFITVILKNPEKFQGLIVLFFSVSVQKFYWRFQYFGHTLN